MRVVTEEKALRSVGAGWGSIIRDLYKHKPSSVHIDTVKEKFGALRIYFEGNDEDSLKKFREYVFFLEDKSITICEKCGAEGSLRTDRKWYKTLCDNCNTL